jgi:hypothetical protein
MVRCFASISGVTNCWSRVGKNAFTAAMMGQGISPMIAEAAFTLLAQYEHIDLAATWKTYSPTLPYLMLGPSGVSFATNSSR